MTKKAGTDNSIRSHFANLNRHINAIQSTPPLARLYEIDRRLCDVLVHEESGKLIRPMAVTCSDSMGLFARMFLRSLEPQSYGVRGPRFPARGRGRFSGTRRAGGRAGHDT